MIKQFDVIVIGAGQAGLSIGYYLSQASLSYVLIDSNKRVGDSWRNRYDSLVLFTPRSYSDLPGLPFPGDRNGVPTKDEVADYLEMYAQNFSIPIYQNTTVEKLEKTPTGFRLNTNSGELHAKSVVIATGPFHTPYVPKWSQEISKDVFQVHTDSYKNLAQLKEGPVLIVGMGNSGAQIATEIAKGHQVFLSNGQSRKFLPLSIFGKNIFWYLDKLGILQAHVKTKLGAWISKQPDPIFGYGKELKKEINMGTIREKPRAISTDGKSICFDDGTRIEVNNIVWATGFRPDYRWIQISGILNENGKPSHNRGISPVPGLYFLGLPWQYKRGSALIGGVGEDAKHIFEKVISSNLQG